MKKEPWRYVVSGLSFAYIIFLWVRKDIGSVWASMPAERLLPMAVISIARGENTFFMELPPKDGIFFYFITSPPRRQLRAFKL